MTRSATYIRLWRALRRLIARNSTVLGRFVKRPYRIALRRWVCAKSNRARAGAEGLACRLGRCFCILPYAEVSTGDPHPAPTDCVLSLGYAHRRDSPRGCPRANAVRPYGVTIYRLIYVKSDRIRVAEVRVSSGHL